MHHPLPTTWPSTTFSIVIFSSALGLQAQSSTMALLHHGKEFIWKQPYANKDRRQSPSNTVKEACLHHGRAQEKELGSVVKRQRHPVNTFLVTTNNGIVQYITYIIYLPFSCPRIMLFVPTKLPT
ncbi:hypothetical protein F4782DRAFT_347714 [Xylaria castorea]|nr:hypothetical protein F4782DRAFT_347714 [Xylaria castorea]